MINITNQILRFRRFLLDSWDDLDKIMENHEWGEDLDFMNDWLQVNWELFVEKQLLQGKGVLLSYSSRWVLNKYLDRDITHVILCKPKPQQLLFDYIGNAPVPTDDLLIFQMFCNQYMKIGSGIYPPFESVVVLTGTKKRRHKGESFDLSVDTVDFFLCALDDIEPEKLDRKYRRYGKLPDENALG